MTGDDTLAQNPMSAQIPKEPEKPIYSRYLSDIF